MVKNKWLKFKNQEKINWLVNKIVSSRGYVSSDRYRYRGMSELGIVGDDFADRRGVDYWYDVR